jgi:hypothetical protein
MPNHTVRPRRLTRWLRRHSLTLVATLGGAAGVAYAVTWQTSTSSAAPAARLAAPGPDLPAPAPPRDTALDTVQIALILDTSSSMSGLINQARSNLWTMVDDLGRMTRIVDGKTRGVRVELALFEYGNSTLPPSAGYIRQVLPFTSDLDRVSEQLNALYTNGGDEYAGQAIQTALTSLSWSTEPSALRFVFLAGNEGFDQGPVKAATAMQLAAQKDVTVQLIHCGGPEPTWSAAAALAKSDLLTIDQNHVAQHVPSPQDDEILRLGAELNRTYLAYGADGQAAMARQASADASSAKLSKKVALERSQLKAKAGYRNSQWDVVDAVAGNANWLAESSDDALPAQLRGKSLAEKQKLVADTAAERARIKARIAKLEAERAAFVAAEQARRAAAEPRSLETEMKKTSRKAAAAKGYRF